MVNIVLIGMSGVGKTEKGKYIARKMDRDFIDTDFLVTVKESLSIDDIFKKSGEEYFRNIEAEIIKQVSNLQSRVISTGGGIVLREANIGYLKSNGFIVYLKSDVGTIVTNLSNSKTIRPLLKNSPNLYQSVYNLYQFRKELYQSYSDLIINVEDKSIEDVYNEVLIGYSKYITCGK